MKNSNYSNSITLLYSGSSENGSVDLAYVKQEIFNEFINLLNTYASEGKKHSVQTVESSIDVHNQVSSDDAALDVTALVHIKKVDWPVIVGSFQQKLNEAISGVKGINLDNLQVTFDTIDKNIANVPNL